MAKKLILLFLVFVFVISRKSQSQIRINEFLASNATFNPENYDFDDFSDWIELYNEGDQPVNIGSYYLSEDLNQPRKWQIPSGTTVPSKGYLLIWADGHNGKPGQQEVREWYPFDEDYTLKSYHAEFKLDKEGEQVCLTTSSGEIVDTVTFGQQFRDVSMGRTSEGSWAFFDEPTPQGPNNTTAKSLQTNEKSQEVTFSIESGFYSSSQAVSLSANEGSDIYFTTDGSIPYSDDSRYLSPIQINKTTIIRARTINSEKFAGEVTTNTYFINEKKRTVMIVSLATDSDFLNNEDYGIWANDMKGREVPVSLEFFSKDGKCVARCNAGVRNGTLTSFGENQHPLQIALRDRYGDQFVEYDFFSSKPITKFRRLRLRQGGDVWASNFIGDAILDPINKNQTDVGIQAYTPVVVFVNGEYYGLMNLREQFKEQYFIENYGVEDPTQRSEVRSILTKSTSSFGFGTSLEEVWELVHGSWDPWRSLISLVTSGRMDDSRYNQVKELVDIASLSDFVILIDFGKAISWGHNEDVWKMPDGKWKWLVTDFDRAWISEDSYSGIDHNLFTTAAGVSGNIMERDTLFSKLVAHTDFKNYFIQRYAAHLNSTLKTERLNAIVDSIADLIDKEMPDHVDKWSNQGGIESVQFWEEEIDEIKDFMNNRPQYCWQHLEDDPFNASSGKSNLSVNISPSDAEADIFVNGVRMSQGLENISLFKDIPFEVKAVGKNGWLCNGWGNENTDNKITITLNRDKSITANFETVSTHKSQKTIPKRNNFINRAKSINGTVVLKLQCSFSKEEKIKIVLFNICGQKIETLMDENIPSGNYNLRIASRLVSSGVYYYRIQTNRKTITETVTVQ